MLKMQARNRLPAAQPNVKPWAMPCAGKVVPYPGFRCAGLQRPSLAQLPRGVLNVPKAAAPTTQNNTHAAGTADASTAKPAARIGHVKRQTKETKIEVYVNIDGTGVCKNNSPIPFLNHMLDQIASHGLFDITVIAEGDTEIDDHHTTEDIALAFGTCISDALGDRKGIHR